MSFNAEALRRREKRRVLCHGRARGGMGWETREACPHEWGHGSLKGYATVLRRRANELRMGFRREDFGRRKRLPHDSSKEACDWGAVGYGSKGGCGIFNTNGTILTGSCWGNGDFEVNVWNRGVYTSKQARQQGSCRAHHGSDIASRAGPTGCVRRQRSDFVRGTPEDHRSGRRRPAYIE